MGIKNTRTYDTEFKHNAITLYEEGDRSYQSIASSLGIPCSTLVGWVKAKEKLGEEAFPGKGHLCASEERFRALERENERLKRERDILKKALAIFSLP
jgi:transposase